nr:reverse transcriptase domain-containing protein [Tanacetum cinerariifolium]
MKHLRLSMHQQKCYEGLKKQMKYRSAGGWYYLDRIRISLTGDVRTLIMDEANKSKYSVHSRFVKMYYDLRDMYWWSKMKKDIALSINRLARLHLNEIIARHGVLILIISDRDSRFISSFWQSMQEALGTSDHSSVRCASFETLYGRKYYSPILWEEVREGQLIGPEIVQETTEKISQIKDRLKATRDRQKSYAYNRRKALEFSVVDQALLKVSPWKGVVCFGKKCKLAPSLQPKISVTCHRCRTFAALYCRNHHTVTTPSKSSPPSSPYLHAAPPSSARPATTPTVAPKPRSHHHIDTMAAIATSTYMTPTPSQPPHHHHHLP